MSAVSGRVCTRVGSALKIRYVVYSALLREDAVEALDLLEDGGELLGGSTEHLEHLECRLQPLPPGRFTIKLG